MTQSMFWALIPRQAVRNKTQRSRPASPSGFIRLTLSLRASHLQKAGRIESKGQYQADTNHVRNFFFACDVRESLDHVDASELQDILYADAAFDVRFFQ